MTGAGHWLFIGPPRAHAATLMSAKPSEPRLVGKDSPWGGGLAWAWQCASSLMSRHPPSTLPVLTRASLIELPQPHFSVCKLGGGGHVHHLAWPWPSPSIPVSHVVHRRLSQGQSAMWPLSMSVGGLPAAKPGLPVRPAFPHLLWWKATTCPALLCVLMSFWTPLPRKSHTVWITWAEADCGALFFSLSLMRALF